MADTTEQVDPVQDTDAAPEPRPKAAPIDSRFLFVDVAAMRAKQLKRGALPRLDHAEPVEAHHVKPIKCERVAMEEVRRGLVLYDVPETPKPAGA